MERSVAVPELHGRVSALPSVEMAGSFHGLRSVMMAITLMEMAAHHCAKWKWALNVMVVQSTQPMCAAANAVIAGVLGTRNAMMETVLVVMDALPPVK